MNNDLGHLNGKTLIFEAQYLTERQGRRGPLYVFQDITYEGGAPFRDHIHCPPRPFRKLRLRKGDKVRFRGEVSFYLSDDIPPEYKASIRSISHAEKI